MAHSPRPRKTLVEAQPGLYVTVGPAGDEHGASNAKHQSDSLEALEVLFKQRSMSEQGKPDPCEREWGGRDKDGQVIWKSPKLGNPRQAARFRADNSYSLNDHGH